MRPALRPRRDRIRGGGPIVNGFDMAPASNHDGGSPQTAQFRGSITRHLVELSTPRSGSFPPPRQTRFRLLVPALPGGIRTRRVPVKGFRMLRFFLPFPSYLAQGSFCTFLKTHPWPESRAIRSFPSELLSAEPSSFPPSFLPPARARLAPSTDPPGRFRIQDHIGRAAWLSSAHELGTALPPNRASTCDEMLHFRAFYLHPSHGSPLEGREKGHALTDTRQTWGPPNVLPHASLATRLSPLATIAAAGRIKHTHPPRHRLSAWATRGLAGHTEL